MKRRLQNAMATERLQRILRGAPKERTAADIAFIDEHFTRRTKGPALKALPEHHRVATARFMTHRSLAPGEILFREGDTCGHMYVVLSGHLICPKFREARAAGNAAPPFVYRYGAHVVNVTEGDCARFDGLAPELMDPGP